MEFRTPSRPAPSVPNNVSTSRRLDQSKKPIGQVKPKKKPPPRPPPPKFNNKKIDNTSSLIDLSAPIEEYVQAISSNGLTNNIDSLLGDSVWSAQSYGNNKPTSNSNNDVYKSKDNDLVGLFTPEPSVNNNDIFKRRPLAYSCKKCTLGLEILHQNGVCHSGLAAGTSSGPKTNVVAPTIIRAQQTNKREHNGGIHANCLSRNHFETNNYSPPMPTIPPPSPPKNDQAGFDDSVPHAVALYKFPATEKTDLSLEVNDVIILIRKINSEWLYGKIGEEEGMFPADYVDIRVPLPETDDIVTALYDFTPYTQQELRLVPGQKIRVIQKSDEGWLFGESNGKYGDFPANYVDRIPPNI